MLQHSDVIAFAGTADLARARDFYADVLGLALVEQNPYACVFDANATMLRVTAVGRVQPSGYTILGWRVDDIDVAIDGLAAADVAFMRYDGMDQDERGVWTAPGGDRIAWFRDPDANVLSLTEFAP